MNKIDIIGIGFCGVDTIGTVPYIPIDSKVEMKNIIHEGAGPTATAVVTAAKLGASTGFIGKVGDDANGKFILDEFKKYNVDVKGIVIEKGASSASSLVWVDEKTGKRSIAWNMGTKSSLKLKELDKESIKSSKVLHLDGHEIAAALEAGKLIKNKGGKVSLDGGTITPNIEEIIKITDILIVSEEFAVGFTGCSNSEDYLEKLWEFDPEVLIVTKGENGLCAYIDGEYIERDAFKVNAVNTTAAGDVFHGAFLFAYISDMETRKALAFASAVAALKCTQYSVRPAIPTYEKTMRFIKNNED